MRKLILLSALLLLAGRSFPESPKAPNFSSDAVWLDAANKAPHSIQGYRGHVLLIDFWEYTCINCIRDFAVLKRWYAKYHPFGFDIVGVHYGEFAIGYKVENVRRAASRFRLPWPIVVDLRGSIWNAYHSQAWPNRYLIDQTGNIVLHVEGEGNNEEIEAKLRELLRGHPEVSRMPLDPGENTLAPQCGRTTEETYVGNWFGHGAVENHQGYDDGYVVNFTPVTQPPDDGRVLLASKWRTNKDGVTTADKHGGKASLRYHARSVYAVMGLEDPKSPVRVYLAQDGKPLTRNDAGKDVQFDSQGSYVEVDEARMYDLVKNPFLGPHLLALDAQGRGFTLYSFTYGNNCQQNFGE